MGSSTVGLPQPSDSTALPPLPPGAKLTAPASPSATALPPLPPGAKLNGGGYRDAGAAAQPTPPPDESKLQEVPEPSTPQYGAGMDEYGRTVENAGSDELGRGMAKSLLQPVNVIHKLVTGKNIDGLDTEPHGTLENIGASIEAMGEFLAGEGFVKYAAFKAMSAAEKFGVLSKALKVIEQSPTLTKAMGTFLRQGAVGTGMGLAHGEDLPAALGQGAAVGATGGVLEGVAGGLKAGIKRIMPTVEKIGGVEVPVPAAARYAKPTPTQAAGQKVYREAAQEAARPALEEIEAAAGKAEAVTPRTSVAEHLNRVHDFTGAADLVDEQAKAIYQKADALTGGKFKAANDEVRAAQKAAWRDRGVEAQERLAKAKGELEQIISDLKGPDSGSDQLLKVKDGEFATPLGGSMTPEEVAAARTAFRRGYVLRDVANTLDSSWSGMPGASARANAYRGFDGNQLMRGLQRLTRQMGRGGVENAIGAERLQNLERIAELNRTGQNRQKFGAAIDQVGRWMQSNGVRHVSWPVAGGALGEMTGAGWAVGATSGEAAYLASRKVMQAISANPKLGQYLTYAIDSGARPEYYAPMLGAMIQQMQQPETKEDKQP